MQRAPSQAGPTAAGDVEWAIPKLREKSFFPSLKKRRRIDRALYAVMMEAYIHGVSTLKVDELIKALGSVSGISRNEVSPLCPELDRDLDAFRSCRLDHRRFPYVLADATYLKDQVLLRCGAPWQHHQVASIRPRQPRMSA